MKKILFLLLCTVSMYGQVSTGQEQEFDYGIKNNSTQTVTTPTYLGTVGADGTYGKILLADLQGKKSFLSTGLIKNGLISTNVDPTKFNITAGIGIISNFDDPENPTSTLVNFPAFTGITPTYLLTGTITYVAINSTPAVVMQATPFTPEQRRSLIILGAVIHSNLTNINVVNNISAPSNSSTNQLHDFIEAVGALNLTGNKYTANGANLQLNKSAGTIFKMGINFANDWKNPHSLAQTAGTSLTFRYRTQNGTEGSDRINLDPALYDLNNILTSVPNNKFTIQTVVMFQTGLTRILYGQNVYDDLASAKAAVFTRQFVIEPNSLENGIIRGYIIMKNTTTSLQNASDAEILEAQKFGGVASGGIALTLANIVSALGFTPANDVDVIHKTGDEVKSGSLESGKNFIVNSTNGSTRGLMIQTSGISRWYTYTDGTESGGNSGGDFKIEPFSDVGSSLGAAVSINRASKLITSTAINANSLNSNSFLNITSGSDIFSTTLNTIASQTGQPFIKSNKGYYVFQPSNASTSPRFYLIPTTGVSGTSSKFEMFNSDYITDAANYNALNIITNNVNNDIQFGANRLGTAPRLKMVFGGDYVGSALTATSSRLEFFTNDALGLNTAGGAITFGANATDPFSFSIANQYTFKNPTTNQATRLNIVGNGTAAGVLSYGTGSVRNASTSVIGGTSDYVISTNKTNTGTTLTDQLRMYASNGHVVMQDGGTYVNDVTNRLKVVGTISASAATLSDQVVVKSQLDLKSDLASPTFTGTPLAPTAAPGTNTTQIATTAFVLANAAIATGSLEFDSLEKTVWNNGRNNLSNNTSFGENVLNQSALSGNFNTAFGGSSLRYLTTGANNVSLGYLAGAHSSAGLAAMATGSNSIFIGNSSRALGDGNTNEIVIGYLSEGKGSNTVTLGNDNIVGTYLKGKVIINNVIRLTGYTVATLPAGVQGDTAYVTDALAPSYMVSVVGGGAVVTVVFFNGTNWVSH